MSAPLALIEDGPAADGRVVALRGEIDVGIDAVAARLARAGVARAGASRSSSTSRNVDFMAVSGLYVLCDEQARMARHHARLTDRVLERADAPALRGLPPRRRAARSSPTAPRWTARPWDADDDERAERLGGVARALLGRRWRRGGVAPRRRRPRRRSRRARSTGRAAARSGPASSRGRPSSSAANVSSGRAPAGDLEHRPDERAVHVAHERVGGDPELEDVAALAATRRSSTTRSNRTWSVSVGVNAVKSCSPGAARRTRAARRGRAGTGQCSARSRSNGARARAG